MWLEVKVIREVVIYLGKNQSCIVVCATNLKLVYEKAEEWRLR